MTGIMILQFLVLTTVVTGTIIFFLHRTLISSTDGAVKRLNSETEALRSKQSELDEKIKAADEELSKRKKEAEALTQKMLEEANEAASKEREEIIKKARMQGEEIIDKAQRTKDKIREMIEVEMILKTVDYAGEILRIIVTEKAREAFHTQLVEEFIEKLEKVKMDKINPDVDTAEVIAALEMDSSFASKISSVIKNKLNRAVKVQLTVDSKIIGGIVLKFGSLALDGSLEGLIKETSDDIKKKKEDGIE